MTVIDLLLGKKVVIDSELGKVTLEIRSIEEKQKSREVGVSNEQNDWYPDMVYWTEYEVGFTNGGKKTFSKLTDIFIL